MVSAFLLSVSIHDIVLTPVGSKFICLARFIPFLASDDSVCPFTPTTKVAARDSQF